MRIIEERGGGTSAEAFLDAFDALAEVRPRAWPTTA
jgi:hypothetical protein